MKLQVTQQNLNKALSTVARVASTRSSLPILANVLIKAEKSRLSISATNLDIAITHHIGSKIDKDGVVTIPARLTQDFVSNLPDSVLDLTLDGHKLSIETDKYQSTINGIPADDFPVMPAISGGAKWRVEAKEFKKSLSQVVFAASNDDARPVLTGVYFNSHRGDVVVAATDSYRLAENRVGKSKQPINFLVPATAINDVLRIIAEEDKEVVITHDDQQVSFEMGDVTLVARLVEGNYPDYRKLLPSKFETIAKTKRADFANITKVSSLFARESAGSVTINVDKKNSLVSIKAIASQIGENTAAASAEVTGGGEVTLNSRYLIDALNAFSGEGVEFCFNGKLEPCILRSTTEPGYTHLIMPLRS
ncbi:DNA polymerase III subunit beta [Candidatus Saccharibacteria bacterium RIFCSPHIGHO2_01_FULL_48_12]|nr:MAG: DNA polymerase III subunit beta [Candidatus Saccharibacteria bacterium RIFCSPHIGHO2_01_FULL_48_12]OGL36522.1 MAG: DNA polymerase III subunit beta [Candidatus Saccharibacteria bacterium RIFCSPHIGHO2_12_FULL_48_21]